MEIQLCIQGNINHEVLHILATDLVVDPILGFTVNPMTKYEKYHTITFNTAGTDTMIQFIDILEINKVKLEKLMEKGATCIFIQCFDSKFLGAGGLIVYGDCHKNLYYLMNFREFHDNLHLNCARCRDNRRPEVKITEPIHGHTGKRSINASRFETPSLWKASQKVVDARTELKNKISRGFSEIRNRLIILPQLKANLELANMEYEKEEMMLREVALANIDNHFESGFGSRPVYPPLKEDEILVCMCTGATPLVMPSGNEPIFRE
jgi:hypothetical protein